MNDSSSQSDKNFLKNCDPPSREPNFEQTPKGENLSEAIAIQKPTEQGIPYEHICKSCQTPVEYSHIDDVGTIWYKCPFHGYIKSRYTQKELKEKLKEQLTPKESIPKTQIFFESLFEHDIDHYSANDYYDENERFNPIKLANQLLTKFSFWTCQKTKTVYVYNPQKGIYEANGEALVHHVVTDVLGEENRQRYYKEIMFYIQGQTYFNPEEHQTLKLAVENGLLDPETQQIEAFTPALFVINQLPITYDKDKDCPEIKQFLREILDEKYIPVIQEYCGYFLLKKLPFHKDLFLIGEGANGKTTFINLLEAFIGKENCSSTTIQDICNSKFSIAELQGKLANLCDDLPSNKLQNTGKYKMVTGGSPVQAQRKFKNPFTFHNFAKMVFTGNILPQITSTEDKVAFHRRNIIIPFNQKFVGRNCDKNKLEKITTPEELSGLLNYALEGLKRLMENKSFSIEENPEEMRNEYIKHSNSALAFTETQLKASLNPEDELDKREVFKDYKTYCKKNKLKAVTERTLNSTIKDAFQDVEDFVTSKDGKSVRKWRYLKKNYETSETTDSISKEKNKLSNYSVEEKPCSSVSSVVSEDSGDFMND